MGPHSSRALGAAWIPISRYDQRKIYEEAEANAIGTEFVRADLLLPRMRRECVCCSGTISISVFFAKAALGGRESSASSAYLDVGLTAAMSKGVPRIGSRP
jgi:hypothetical protein